MGKKFNFSAIKRKEEFGHKGYDRDSNQFRDGQKDKPKYMKFGNDNQYPEYLISLYNQSSIHASCINAIVQAITGDGLVCDNEDYLKRANRDGESWNDIFYFYLYIFPLHVHVKNQHDKLLQYEFYL